MRAALLHVDAVHQSQDVMSSDVVNVASSTTSTAVHIINKVAKTPMQCSAAE
jgi:hypothetical protein